MSVKVPGIEMTFGGAAYVVPPLNAAAVKQYRAQIGQLLNAGLPDMGVICTLLHCALQRNYPEVTIEQAEEWVDFSNVMDVMEALMSLSGLVAKAGELSRRLQAATQPPASTN